MHAGCVRYPTKSEIHNPKSKTMKHLLAIVGALAALIVVATPHAAAQTSTVNLTLSNTTAVGNATTTVTSQGFWIKQGAGFAVLPNFVLATGSETGNLTFRFQVSSDNSTWSTTTPISVVVPATGNTAVRAYALVPPTTVDHVGYARLVSVQNANTANATLSNITISRRTD